MNDEIYENDEFRMWVEDEASIHIKAVTKYGDPVELTFDEAEEIANALLQWVKKYR
ncbi:MAG TPA: hypothetical protein VGU61_06290 [Noviherbaspirillum sp.]|uniref:hypothetical protein n=1 Tax=Noviherbaspirillum sp. TaxID=1926288 RepID=UPI002DDD38DA|nr:hypothetical protein [Noviherbaspirillum sp.]HEV2609858.1 hypothetical protein [Noviherbaspirillum sp.]